MSKQHQVVIVGGGSAGISVAARLKQERADLDIAIIDPAEHHYYQPLWTLVGAGIYPKSESQRNEADLIPAGVTWIKDSVETFSPGDNRLTTANGETIEYQSLVVCAGIQLNWSAIKGLTKSLVGTGGICSNYSPETVESTWKAIQAFQGGTALFTHPNTAVKCGGAPQKICYLAEDYFRRQGIREKCEVVFCIANPRIFAVDPYATTLESIVKKRNIDVRLQQDLVEIKPESKTAIFEHQDTSELSEVKYDMLHVTPKMGPPDFIKNSELAGEGGWVEVDAKTTQHLRFSNVFALGDCSSLPTSKTAAAIRKQVPVTVANLLAQLDGQALTEEYDGYTSCPLVTGYQSMVLAEFDYDKKPCETFPFDQSKERFSMMMVKKHVLPNLYWHGMLKGRA